MNDSEYDHWLNLEAVARAQGLPRLARFAARQLERREEGRARFRKLMAEMAREAEETRDYEVSAEAIQEAIKKVRKRKEEE